MYCEQCKTETNHFEEDLGYGWTEYGSKGENHCNIVMVCSICGAINDNWDGGECPI